MTQRRMARPSLGGLMATRQGALSLAVVCAVCAAGILVFALGRYRTSVTAVPKQATVLVATASIPKGTAGDAVATRGLYKSTPIVATQLVPGAISDAGMLTGKVAAADILPGQQLTLADFTAVVGVAGLLAPNQRAIAFTITESPGATDILQPGDTVDLYSGFGLDVVLLVPNALVIKTAATTAVSAGGKSVAGTSLVIRITGDQAADVVYAAEHGVLYLTLRPPNGTVSPRALTTLSSVIQDSVASSLPTTTGTHK